MHSHQMYPSKTIADSNCDLTNIMKGLENLSAATQMLIYALGFEDGPIDSKNTSPWKLLKSQIAAQNDGNTSIPHNNEMFTMLKIIRAVLNELKEKNTFEP